MPTNEGMGRERDLVLAPNEFAYVSDQTKGKIDVYVGPHKTSLAQTDQPVIFDDASKKFKNARSLDEAIQLFKTAPEGWYLTLKNPASDGQQPSVGGVGSLPALKVGRKINVPGPVSYPIWPGQMVKIVKGHHLRSNQYILARVYDEEGAKANWGQAVIKTTSGDDKEQKDVAETVEAPDFTMGKLIVIKGTEVSFYIPPTGIEVVADEDGNLVREAETLERLEYCILKDEDGNKRYVRGPAVVFPEPTEQFITKKGSRKFKAIELNENSGLYIKVIADYDDHKVGDELFITGNEQMIYFPREEHAIIKYGDQDIHFAIAIPAGEARYVLNRMTGEISIMEGPKIFLPDPRKEVIVRRMLPENLVKLWFPGNKEALSYNQDLEDMLAKYSDQSMNYVSDRMYTMASSSGFAASGDGLLSKKKSRALKDLVGDDFDRKHSFTPPRTITLDTKYEGTIDIDVWTGYAVLVVSKTGTRRVVVGPDTVHLAYDESLGAFELSTGNPKNTDDLIKDVYLRVLNNKVSDTITAVTKDLCEVDIKVSYRVNFEGEKEAWFNVENYVKLLTDHLRSIVRGAVKAHGIEDFYANSIEIVRDIVLGKHTDKGRSGKFFSENGMRVTDVEVLNVRIGDSDIEELLVDNQFEIVQQTLKLAKNERAKMLALEEEKSKRIIDDAKVATRIAAIELARRETKKSIERWEAESDLNNTQEKIADAKHQAKLDREIKDSALTLKTERGRLLLRKQDRDSETKAVVEKANAIQPDLIAAIQTIGDQSLLEKMSANLNVLSILGGKSLADVAAKFVKGTKLEGVMETIKKTVKK